MSEDLVRLLRRSPNNQWMLAAADEIERLQTQVFSENELTILQSVVGYYVAVMDGDLSEPARALVHKVGLLAQEARRG